MAVARAYTTRDLDLVEQRAQEQARASFWAFRQYIHGEHVIKGWFPRQIARDLQVFAELLLAGKRPHWILCTPPQHGKSWTVVDFVAWLAGKDPDKRAIYASYAERLGIRANLQLQRIYDSPRYKAVFLDTRLNESNAVTVSGRSLRNQEVLEYVGRRGFFRQTTVRGAITGDSVDLGLVDDPIKGREEASSATVRQKTWEWYTDDFKTRFSEQSGMLMILTRWHTDDPAGRLIESNPDVRVIRYPAIAEENERHRKKGEPLFPELKSLEFLMEQRRDMTEASWESVYQQNPIVRGGGLFPIERIAILDHAPAAHDVVAAVRSWDKAGTAGGSGAQTAGVLMLLLRDGRFVVADCVSGRWSALTREERIRHTAHVDGKKVIVWVEQEPGSGGKESAGRTIANLAGWKVYADRVTGDKVTRAEPYAAQVEGGNVALVRGEWNRDFLEQHEHFPAGKLKDQVDAASGAFARLPKRTRPGAAVPAPGGARKTSIRSIHG